MAIFESSVKRKPGTRSNTKLAVSGGDSPAGQWVTDPNLPILFHYNYGGPGQKEVVVSKGLLVGVADKRYKDDALGYDKNALTIATKDIRPFGMAPYNFTKHWEDFLDGNQPSVITREYVELPLIGNADDAANIKWGAAYHEGSNVLKANDLVTWSRNPENYGKIIKWVEGTHSFADIIGQVGEVEDDQEPFGWLKWAMWDESARREDQDGPVNKSGYSAPGDGGYPFDPEYTRLGRHGENGYLDQYTTLNDAAGIPGLTDGRNKAETQQTRDFNAGTVAADGTVMQLSLGLKNIIDGTVEVFIDSVKANADRIAVDAGRGVVALTLDTVDSNKDIQVRFRAEFFGTPAGWDHKGAVGVARILLKF
jgi:hypothetical protein